MDIKFGVPTKNLHYSTTLECPYNLPTKAQVRDILIFYIINNFRTPQIYMSFKTITGQITSKIKRICKSSDSSINLTMINQLKYYC